MSTLSSQITSLKDDYRMKPLLCDDSTCALQIWFLKDSSTTTLLYGWVIRTTHPTSEKWAIYHVPGLSGNARLLRISLFQKSTTILNIITKLLEGYSLIDASSYYDLNILLNDISSFNLGSDSEIAECFYFRPPVFYQIEIDGLLRKEVAKSWLSPSYDIPAFCASLFSLNKGDLFPIEYDTLKDSQIKKCLECLEKDTGIQFTGSDCGRLGNIEFLNLPFSDDYENSLVSINTILVPDSNGKMRHGRVLNTAKGVSIKVNNVLMPNGTKLLVHCCIRNTHAIVFDQIKEVEIYRGSCCSEFVTDEQVSDFDVAIWKLEEDGSWALYYKNGWAVWGRRKESWSNSLDEVKKVVSSLFSKSDTQKGTYGQEDFVDSFKEKVRNSNTEKIIFADPYFDETGLQLIYDSMKQDDRQSNEVKFEVLVNCELQSDDLKKGKLRMDSLIDKCNDIDFAWEEISIELVNIKVDKKVFHDRNWIINKKTGDEAYNLSRSIQLTRSGKTLSNIQYPQNLAKRVIDEVQELRNPPKNSRTGKPKHKVDILYSSKMTHKVKTHPTGLDSLINPRMFFSILLRKRNYLNLSIQQLKKSLRKNGFLINKSLVYPVDQEKCISSFISYLEKLDTTHSFIRNWYWKIRKAFFKHDNKCRFIELWTDFARIALTNDRYLGDRFTIISESSKYIFNKQLYNYINEYPSLHQRDRNEKLKLSGEEKWMRKFISRSFKDCLHDAEHIFNFRHYGVDWGVVYALKYLFKYELKSITKYIEKLTDILRKENNKVYIKNIVELLLTFINECVDEIYQYNINFIKDLITSSLPSLRSLGVQGLIHLRMLEDKEIHSEELNISQAIAILRALPTEYEYTLSLAEYLHQMWWQNESDRTVNVTGILDSIKVVKKELLNSWPNNLSALELMSVIYQLSNSRDGRWAGKITNKIFKPLINRLKITHDKLTDLWLDILYSHLGYKNDVNNENRKSLFVKYDVQIIETCAWCLAFCSDGTTEKWVTKINKVVKEDLHIILKPFIRKIDYGLNHDIIVRLMYVYSVVSLISYYWDVDNSSLENGKKWNKLAQIIKGQVMPRFKESERWQTDEGLIAYLEDIQNRIYVKWMYS